MALGVRHQKSRPYLRIRARTRKGLVNETNLNRLKRKRMNERDAIERHCTVVIACDCMSTRLVLFLL